jgi:2-iminoacetate synthase
LEKGREVARREDERGIVARMAVSLNPNAIYELLGNAPVRDAGAVKEILARARELNGLEAEDVATLSAVSDPELTQELFDTAQQAKIDIYGRRLVLFAPLYVSNMCGNECLYCAFRARNSEVERRALSQEEIARETRVLLDQGHKRLLLVAGESYSKKGIRYILDSLETMYGVKTDKGEVRRINVNIAPLETEEFSELKKAGIGTYQLFQETYHQPTYEKVHTAGKKADYTWRLETMDRALTAGIDDVGIGVLFGLADWRFEMLALLQHIRHLEQKFGIGPHTISVPRLEPATGSDLATQPPQPVSDADFRKIVAILRLAVPYTGIIMSTRETANLRRESFALGVSQISAGSRTNPGGYSEDPVAKGEQFSLGDHRSLDDVVRDVSSMGYVPSFCTACYRLGRTGADFMDLAKPGEIKNHCGPNALATFLEYMIDFGTSPTREVGERLIQNELLEMDEPLRTLTEKMLTRVRDGHRDVYC